MTTQQQSVDNRDRVRHTGFMSTNAQPPATKVVDGTVYIESTRIRTGWAKIGTVARAPGNRWESADIRGKECARAAHTRADAVRSILVRMGRA